MQKNHLKKMFKLEGYILDRIEDKKRGIFLHCHLQKRSMIFKGESSSKVNQVRTRVLTHMQLEDRTVFIIIRQRRFYFSKHKTKRWESIPGTASGKQTTNTFRLNTLRELMDSSYSSTGKKRGRSGMFGLRLLDDLPIKLKWAEGITKVGLDGKGASKRKLIHNLTDPGDKKPIGVFANLNQKELKKSSWRFRRDIDLR